MKAEYLRLPRALPPQLTSQGQAFVNAAGKNAHSSARDRIRDMLGDDHRLLYLPANVKIPRLLIDFERAVVVERGTLRPLRRRGAGSGRRGPGSGSVSPVLEEQGNHRFALRPGAAFTGSSTLWALVLQLGQVTRGLHHG